MRDFKTLNVWQRAHTLTIDVYRITGSFPTEELYGLVSQIRSACASIPANIAEGCGRDSQSELRHFLQISMGSATEVECHLILARDLSYIDSEQYDRLNNHVIDVKRMLTGFIQRVRLDS